MQGTKNIHTFCPFSLCLSHTHIHTHTHKSSEVGRVGVRLFLNIVFIEEKTEAQRGKVSKVIGSFIHSFTNLTNINRALTSLGNIVKHHLYNFSFFFFLISQARWHAPVVPATWEAEVRGLLEPRRLRLQ